MLYRWIVLYATLLLGSLPALAEPVVERVKVHSAQIVGGEVVEGVALFRGPTAQDDVLTIRARNRVVESVRLQLRRGSLDGHFRLRTQPVTARQDVEVTVGQVPLRISVLPPPPPAPPPAPPPDTQVSTCTDGTPCEHGWCRQSCEDANVTLCVAYQSAGQSCGGFTPACMAMTCGPGLVCDTSEVPIADAPGVCRQMD